MSTPQLQTQTPRDIDLALAPLIDATGKLMSDRAMAGMRLQQNLEWLAKVEPDGYDATYSYGPAIEKAEKRIAELAPLIAAAQDAERPFHAEYRRRGGWARAYLVDNSNGHVHRNTSCRTCYATTEFVWLPELSGSDDEEIMAAAGSLTCVACYPQVRAEVLAQRPTIEAPARRASRLEREEKARARAEKAARVGITALDGGPLHEVDTDFRTGQLREGRILKTEVAAWRLALEQAWDLAWYRNDHPSAPVWAANVDRMIAAVAAKRGVTPESLRAEVDAKTAAKMRKAGR